MIRDRLFIEQNRIRCFSFDRTFFLSSFLSLSFFLPSFLFFFLSSFFSLFFFLSFSNELKCIVKNHESRNSFRSLLGSARQFLFLWKSGSQKKKKKSIWMTVDKEKVFWKLVKKSIGEREGIGEWILKKCWFSTKEDWIRNERDPAILFQLRSVNIKSRREGFGWKFKDISRG